MLAHTAGRPYPATFEALRLQQRLFGVAVTIDSRWRCDRGAISTLDLSALNDAKNSPTDRFDVMKSNAAYFICVMASRESGQVIASATLVLEWKFIHACGFRGRIEDVVVDTTMRGRKLGNLFVL